MQLNYLRDILTELKEQSAQPQPQQTRIYELIARLEKGLNKAEEDLIDIRDYCENYHQPLCITDKDGIVIYANDLYTEEIQLTSEEILGKPESFPNPISRPVLEKRHCVVFGNNGSLLNLKKGHMVSGVPIFNKEGKIRNIVITLDSDETLYQRYRELRELMGHRENMQVWHKGGDLNSTLLGKHPVIQNVHYLVHKVASTDATVLITGESGTGKEVVADNIYSCSKRKGKPFIKINCTAIPANLLEPELFGYEKGAFTGATSRKLGLFEVANHGTILLDEIGDLPLDLQPKLLRVLQQGEIYRIGSSVPTKVDVRVIAATNIDLSEKIRAGLFREDLFYRINVFPIHLPPLRERGEDIIELADYFRQEYSQKYDRITSFSPEILEQFLMHRWPGNVRELQNVVEYYVICSDHGKALSKEHLSRILHLNQQEKVAVSSGPPTKEHVVVPEEKSSQTLYELRDSYEKQLIINALKRTGNSRRAAQLLGVLPSTLYRKAQKYNIPLVEIKELHYE